MPGRRAPLVRRRGLPAAAALACAPPTAPFPATAVPFAPPPQFALWWQMTEACAGAQAPLAAVRWYTVPGGTLPPGTVPDTPDAQGATFFDAHGARVVLADSLAANPLLVRHEMLHALLRTGDHPTAAFRARCGGIVACDGPCAAETGRDTLPLAGTATVDVAALAVATDLAGVPVRLSAGDSAGAYYGGRYAVIASVHNPRPTAVWARLRVFPYNPAAAATFGVVFLPPPGARGPASSQYAYVFADSVPFGPGETKRYAFDEQASAYNPRPGVTVRAFFNVDTAAAALPLVVTP